MKNVSLAVLMRDLLEDPSVAAAVWQTIADAHPDLQPKRYGLYEPLPHKVEGSFNVSDALREWHSPVFWSHGGRASGSFSFGDPRLHSKIGFTCTGSKIPPPKMIGLLRELATKTDAEFAHVTYRYESRDEWLRRYKALYPMSLGPTTHDLRNSIPELPWLTILGGPYVELFTTEVLSTCPAFASEPLNDHQWLLQLTEHPPGHGSMPSEFEHARANAKRWLGEEHFLDLSRPEAQRTAPPFDWAPPVRNGLLDHLRSRGLINE